MKKVCLITCYFIPDYVRSRTLRAALTDNENVELIIIKNSHTGFLRYPEVLWKIIKIRFSARPDIYLLNFRGQEILPAVLALIWPKKLIFDEFIVPLAWAKQEGHKNTMRTRVFKTMSKVSAPFYKMWLRACDVILTDTEVHAKLSSELSSVPFKKYKVIPVSTDEKLFKPASRPKKASKDFTVFFYGLKMTPLHGLKYTLEAAENLAGKYPKIKFVVVGGDEATASAVSEASQKGARIIYRKFIPFEKLPQQIHNADLCLGGPFGGTPQAGRVVTGKTYQFLASGAPTIIGENKAAAGLTDKKDCLKVEQASAESLTKKIIWAYEHPKELQKIAAAGRQTYEALFSSQVVKGKLNDIIKVL